MGRQPLIPAAKITVFNSPSLTGAGSYCLKTEQEFICLPPKQQIKHQPYPKKQREIAEEEPVLQVERRDFVDLVPEKTARAIITRL